MRHIFKAGTNPDKPVLLHGTGGDENSLLPLAEMVDPESAVLSGGEMFWKKECRAFSGGWQRAYLMKKI